MEKNALKKRQMQGVEKIEKGKERKKKKSWSKGQKDSDKQI